MTKGKARRRMSEMGDGGQGARKSEVLRREGLEFLAGMGRIEINEETFSKKTSEMGRNDRGSWGVVFIGARVLDI